MASELMEEFIFDARDHLTTASTQLLSLEKNPESLADLNALMGTLHTIKGNSGFVNLKNLYGMLHGAENLLQTVRDTPDHVCPPTIVNQLFQVLDAVEAILSRLESGEDEDVDWLPALNQAIAEAEASLGQPFGEPQPSVAETAAATAPDPPQTAAAQAEPESAEPVAPAAEAAAAATAGGPQGSGPIGSGATGGGPTGDGTLVEVLGDGKLAEEGQKYLAFLGNGRGRLILDVNSLTSLGFDEIRLIRELVIMDDARFALVLDREKQPDFWRVLVLWSLENKIRAFPDLASAQAELGA
ncbi:MAG: Hpt domain-containing protein [Deltaproteobacteria bacterium]|jgi:HPt (histidine-containing phosphotransfer) domain-containing protein|nr:Hpt domain-containing protein [Deltaproteobacteria bacterium]